LFNDVFSHEGAWCQEGFDETTELSFYGSFKATWIKKYLDKENCGSWKRFLDSELEKYEGEVTLTGNLNIKDSRNIIKVSDPFFKEILEIRSEANYEEKIVSDYHFRSSPLWYN